MTGFLFRLIAWEWLLAEWLLAEWLLAEWLLAEWEGATGPGTHPCLVVLAGCCGLIWVGLRLNDMIFTSADILVTAITITCCAFLLRIQRGHVPFWFFASFGSLLARTGPGTIDPAG